MNPIYQDSNAYRTGRKDGYDEIMSQMSDIIGKCYNTGYKDAMDFVCEWLTVNSGLPLHYEEYQKYHEEFLDNLRKAMEEHLCKETSKSETEYTTNTSAEE